MEVSVVVPCLNEVETIGTCVAKALRALDVEHIDGEGIVSDTGSTDGSQEIAARLGARVLNREGRDFQISKSRGIPAPYPVALGDNWISRFLLKVNDLCLRLFPTLFSYQIVVVATPRPVARVTSATGNRRIRHARGDA